MKVLLLIFLCFAQSAAAADGFVVTDVVLVDVRARALAPAELHVRDGRIERVTGPGGLATLEVARRWSAGGRFALPPMLDASTFASTQVSPGHRDDLGPDDARRLFLAVGIHDFVDLAGGTGSLSGGPVLTAVGGVGTEIPGAIELADEAAARSTVKGMIDATRRPDRLSVILDRGRQRRGLAMGVLAAILQEAGDVPVAVYAGTWRDVEDALEAGANWIVQIPPGPVPDTVLEVVRRSRPAWTPTVAVATDFMALMAEPDLRQSAVLARALPVEMRSDYGEVRVPQSRLSEARLQNADRMGALAALNRAGVTLVAGSQSGGLGTAHGFTFVRELEAWGRAGLGAWTVLAAATVNGADRLGLDRGQWEGAPASFSLYPVSPTDSLGILASPDFVFVDGRRETPASLAMAVQHSLTEDVPENPMPGDNRWSLLLLAIAGFTVLLFVRHLIRRAAARAMEP